jgi:hypothetical protein
MLTYRYNPFTKPLSEFPVEELGVLRNVSEGWFVDYKGQPISARDFGKHLSAFANRFGGWLFVGVAEGPNKSLKAGSFPGIPAADVGGVMAHIRDGVSVHVSPTVYFEYRLIEGPVDTIGLESGKSIIVVAVPEGLNPPYVHSSGRIYRRIADSSEPKAETDRAVLDDMWHKSENLRERLEKFVLKPTETEPTANTFCYIYLMEDLTMSLPEYGLDLAGFREAMRTETPHDMSIPLDNIYSTQDGFIARHYLQNNDPLNELITLRWWRSGNVRLTIPINYVNITPWIEEAIFDDLFNDFRKIMGNKYKEYRWILNLDQWLLGLLTLTGRYLDLRDKVDSKDRIYGKIVFSNVRLRTPFIGMESYLKNVRQYGIPVVQDNLAIFPLGTELNAFRLLSDPKHGDRIQRSFALIAPLVIDGLKSLGVMFDVESDEQFAYELNLVLKRGFNKRR